MRAGSSNWLLNLNFLWFFFLLLFVNHGVLFVMVEAGCTTSCGKLSNISFPFRVRDDPKHCGDANFELFCEDGEAFFYMGAHKYLVTHIEYYSDRFYRGGNMTIHVDCPFTTSTCRLPDSFSFPKFIYGDSWVSFMSCLEKIENHTFLPIPSLSGENAFYYVVVGREANELFFLYHSCKFVDTFPFTIDYSGINSSMQVIEALQKGFNLPWVNLYVYDYIDFWYYVTSYPYLFSLDLFSCLSTNSCQQIKAIIENLLWSIIIVLLELTVVCKFVLIPLTVYVYLMLNYWKSTRPVDSIEMFLQKQQVLLPRRYTYGEIIVMTRHFKEKLGKGGFGQVYKGELFGGRPVAVKVLGGLHFNGEEFTNEVSTIGMIHHVNIVQLLGFCSEGNKRALIYEYMPNGSLDRYIFSSDENSTNISLALEKLHSIALGIAKGINYLHTGCDVQILHFDIKPHNILLDDNFTPKISDFGLAKLYPKEQSLVSISAARGTIGYIAPELISRSFGVISQKSDVYSFGMLILEIAGRRRNVDTRMQNSKEIYYPSWIYDQLTQLEAPNINEIIEIGEEERRLCKVGLWCIQMNSSNRPTMSEVVKFLESEVDDIEMPPKPFFLSSDTTTKAYTYLHSSSLTFSAIVEHDDSSGNVLV